MKYAIAICMLAFSSSSLPAQDADKQATLRWFGQSFFQLETSFGKSIVFDPHAIEIFGRPAVNADFVLISHPHNDHNQPEVLANKGFRVFEGVKAGKTANKSEWNPVDEKISDNRIRVRDIGLYHDATNGMQRGKNAAWIVDVDGLTFVHLGDLGHTLTPDQVKAIGKVDVLMIPVGGIYTLNGEQAKTVVEQLKPRLFIVPMHYGVPGYDDILGPDEFLDGFPNVTKSKTNELVIPLDAKADDPKVVLLNWKKEEAPSKK